MINQLKERIEKTKDWRTYHLTENDCIMKNQIAIMEAFIWLGEVKNISSNVPVSGNEANPKNLQSGEVAVCDACLGDGEINKHGKDELCRKCNGSGNQTDR